MVGKRSPVPTSVPSRQVLRDILHRAGLRATASRLSVLALLMQARRPVSHTEVVGALAGQPWDRSTIYRNLSDLVRVGLARKTELGDRVWRFELFRAAHSSSDHPHFVCTECGNVLCLTGVEISATPTGHSPQAIRDEQVEYQIRGRCDDCRS